MNDDFLSSGHWLVARAKTGREFSALSIMTEKISSDLIYSFILFCKNNDALDSFEKIKVYDGDSSGYFFVNTSDAEKLRREFSDSCSHESVFLSVNRAGGGYLCDAPHAEMKDMIDAAVKAECNKNNMSIIAKNDKVKPSSTSIFSGVPGSVIEIQDDKAHVEFNVLGSPIAHEFLLCDLEKIVDDND